MNMIKALGLHPLSKMPKPNAYYHQLNFLSLNTKAFSFMNLSKEQWSMLKKCQDGQKNKYEGNCYMYLDMVRIDEKVMESC